MYIILSSKTFFGLFVLNTQRKSCMYPNSKSKSYTGYPVQLVHIKHTKTCSIKGIYKPKRIVSIYCTGPEVKFLNFPYHHSHPMPTSIFQALAISDKRDWFSREEKKRMFSSWSLSLSILKCFLRSVHIKKNDSFKIRKFSCISSEKHRQCWTGYKNKPCSYDKTL